MRKHPLRVLATVCVLALAVAVAAGCDGSPGSDEGASPPDVLAGGEAGGAEPACLLPEPPERPASDRETVSGFTGAPVELDAATLFGVAAGTAVRWEQVTLPPDSLEYVSQHALAFDGGGTVNGATTVIASDPGRYRVAALMDSERFEVDLDIRPPERREFGVRGVAMPDLFGEMGAPEFDVSPEDPACLARALDHELAGPVRVGANWISLSPANFMTVLDPSPVWGAQYPFQSLTEDAFYTALVDAAHDRGLKVLQAEQDAFDFSVPPEVWERIPELHQRAEWWAGWFDEWTPWVVERAARAEAAGVDAFAPFVWTTAALPADVYPEYVERWTEMVAAIREVYSGDIVATVLVFVDERFLSILDLFDIVIVSFDGGGIAGSEAIADPLNPTVAELIAAFEERMAQAVEVLGETGATVHFGIGAASNSGQGGSEAQEDRAGYEVDFQEQAAYYEAFYHVVERMEWVSGIWIERMDWFDQFARPPEGWYFDATLETSPRSKPAEDIVARWFLPAD